MYDIRDTKGSTINPAQKAGIKVGDFIVKVNDKAVEDEQGLKREIINNGEKPVKLEIKRNDKIIKSRLMTAICPETGYPRLGIYVKDTTSGVGTLSFYHPESQSFAALGHIITDSDNSAAKNVREGKILEASIKGIRKGIKGQPGEKIGMFTNESTLSGNIEKNTKYGVMGKLEGAVNNPYYNMPIPIASSNQINEGPAEILTVIDDLKIEKFSIEIQDIFYPWNSRGKGMVIKITDRKLIDKTGGIIQGMSGSPILQNGMLVGVLTHVFVNDPLRGYGIPAEWMLKELDITDNILQNAS